jgi:chlorite dismutase
MPPIHAEEGWFVLHIYYRIDTQIWHSVSVEERIHCRQALDTVAKEFGRGENCQIHSYSIWGHKADLGFMLIDPDLDHLNQVERSIVNAFPAGCLIPADSFTSMTEASEYVSQDRDYDKTLREKEGLSPESGEYKQKMKAFKDRIQGYINDRLYPTLPDHKVMCFYPMNKARRDYANWYTLDFEKRKQLMAGHMMTGRLFAGKVKQLVTGSIGLDAWEWGVTLFAKDPTYFKQILYKMRYDEVSAVYGEFGDFLIGIRLDPEALIDRL